MNPSSWHASLSPGSPDAVTPTVDVSVVHALYDGEGLARPYLPEEVASGIVPLGEEAAAAGAGDGAAPLAFAAFPDAAITGLPGDVPRDLYALDEWLRTLMRYHSVTLPFAAFGFAGHGVASQAVHYYLATPQVLVMLQKRWGTILDADPAAIARGFAADIDWTRRLSDLATRAIGQSVFPRDQRLVVVESTFSGCKWGWVPSASVTEEEISGDLRTLKRTSALALFAAMGDLESKTGLKK